MIFIKKLYFLFRCFLSLISPRLNSFVCYRVTMGKWLNLKNPTEFNAKLMWLKLNVYANNKMVQDCADKYLVRE